MKAQECIELAQSQLPKYLLQKYSIGKPIYSNRLRTGQTVVGVAHNARSPFVLACEFLGFATFFSLIRSVCREEKLIPDTPDNKDFYDCIASPCLEVYDPETGEEQYPIFFGRTREEPVWIDGLDESIRMFNEGYATPLSDEGFEARIISDPIFIGRSLRRIQKPYILLMRDNESSQWLAPDFSKISWFALTPR